MEETQPVVREEQEVDGCVWSSMRGALCEEIRVRVMVEDKEQEVTVQEPAGNVNTHLYNMSSKVQLKGRFSAAVLQTSLLSLSDILTGLISVIIQCFQAGITQN